MGHRIRITPRGARVGCQGPQIIDLAGCGQHENPELRETGLVHRVMHREPRTTSGGNSWILLPWPLCSSFKKQWHLKLREGVRYQRRPPPVVPQNLNPIHPLLIRWLGQDGHTVANDQKLGGSTAGWHTAVPGELG